ncbi:MAG: OsmC family protein [Bacteroidales bacterium]|nr:OsmC family protein [Bacteroidales bacterium]
MSTSSVIYTGNLRTECTHSKSGEIIVTDAPPDNQGLGMYFSPTDMAATSLASCMLTIIGISARTHNFSIDSTHAEVTKIMYSEPRRIGEIHIIFRFPDIEYSPKQKTIIRRSAESCPVMMSLHPDIIKKIEFRFYGE